jgi:hypothetical protein
MRGAAASLFLVGAFSIVGARYTDAVPVSANPAPPTTELRDCRTRGEGRSPQRLPAQGIRLGPLVIWPSVRLDPGPAVPGDWPYVIKAPVVLPARALLPVSLEAQPRWLLTAIVPSPEVLIPSQNEICPFLGPLSLHVLVLLGHPLLPLSSGVESVALQSAAEP